MSNTSFAGLEFTWTADLAMIESPARVLTISGGPVASHSTSYGGSTTLANVEILGDAISVIGSDTRIVSTGDLILWFGLANIGNSVGSFWLKTGQSHILQVTYQGEWLLFDGLSARIRFNPIDHQRDSIIESGYGNYTRGVVLVHSEQKNHTPGESVGIEDRPGIIVLESVSGVRVFLWARYASGVTELRVDNADPGTNEAPATSKVITSFP